MDAPDPSRSKPQARNSGIDLLRGISIVLVLLNHIGMRMRLTEGVLAAIFPHRFLNDIMFNGYEAVFIFFVISGFLIASNSIVRWGRLGAIHPRSFYIRRAARILPCLLILVAVLSILHLAGVAGYVINQPGQSLPRAIVSALGLHLNWYEGRTGYLPANWDVLWSLSIEEVFYLAFPLVCLALRRDWLLAPVLALLALSLPISLASIVGNGIWKEKAYLPGMAAIALGVLAAILASHFRHPRPPVLRALQALGATGVLAVLGFEWFLWRWLGNGTILLLATSAACLVFALDGLQQNSQPTSLPGTAWLQSFGRLSYEIYLTHMFVVFAVLRIFKASGLGLRWGILWYPPTFAFAWALGWLVARFISTPSELALRRRFLVPKALPVPSSSPTPV